MRKANGFKNTLSLLLALILSLGCIFLYSCNDDVGTEAGDNGSISVKMDILKIGKADCIVIDTGTKIIMIDTGEEENLPTIHSFMNEKEYSRVDILILTHYDKDHIGGATEIIEKYGASTVIESSFSSDSDSYISYHNKLSELGISPLKLSENYSFKCDGCEFDINIPKKDSYKSKQSNNSSLIISMKCGEKRLLFCADAMELRLTELIEDSIGQYDLVKLPYHGNYLENYAEFLDEVKPSYGIITNSKKNPASEDTLTMLYGRDIEVYQTRYGQISVFCDGKEIEINQSYD